MKDKKKGSILRHSEEEVVKKTMEHNSNLLDISNDVTVALQDRGAVTSRDPECIPHLKESISADPTILATDKQQAMIEECRDIHKNTMARYPGNLEIQLDNGVQYSEDGKMSLENAAIAVNPMSMETPPLVLLSIPDAPVNVRIYAAADIQRNAAFLVYQDPDTDEEVAIPLVTMNMLSISRYNQPEKEFGLMTSYLFWTGKLYSSELMARDFSVIKQIFWSNLLLEAWKQETEAHPTLKEEVGDKFE